MDETADEMAHVSRESRAHYSILAESGTKLIVLDNDFPQYSTDDPELASVISRSTSGQLTGTPVPVLMARTINRSTYASVVQVEVPSSPSGVLGELQKLESPRDLLNKYTGTTGVIRDEDQVVRQIACRLPGQRGELHDSIIVKAMEVLKEPIPSDLPMTMDIDFVGPANTELIPIRPMSYLLDPERKRAMISPELGSQDVTLHGAIVFLGDGVQDIFSTATTNLGFNLMSGSEVLANAFETAADHRWLKRWYGLDAIPYLIFSALLGATITLLWKVRQKSVESERDRSRSHRLMRLLSDFACFALTLCVSYSLSCILFSFARIIVPVVSPSIALMIAALATVVWERERERFLSLQQSLKAAQEKLVLQGEVHKAELETQEAESRAREMALDKDRRREFVRRINHDLRAPVSVLSWTIARLKKDGLNSKGAADKVDRLGNTADRMFALINELVNSYDTQTVEQDKVEQLPTDLRTVVSESFKMQTSLAEQRQSTLELSMPETPVVALCNHLQLSRCVDNLIRNALLHNNSGITVQLILRAGATAHEIVVADNGVGISSKHIAHIFDAGYRAQERESDTKHEGLGLSIVKTFVESMRGNISVISKSGEGATFVITLANVSATEGVDPSPVKETLKKPDTIKELGADRGPDKNKEPDTNKESDTITELNTNELDTFEKSDTNTAGAATVDEQAKSVTRAK